MANKKNRLGTVYSTNPDFEYQYENDAENATLAPAQQRLLVQHETKHRGGKEATIVRGFVGTNEDLESLAKLLKTKCGVGGSAKEGEIIIQGNQREKIIQLLTKEKYVAK